jgi:hypothetical protein
MPTTPQQKYELELWINGVQVGDISRIAKNRSFVLRRNASEDLKFTMDLTAFERYCALSGRNPLATLEPYVTDIRVKRNGTYLFGVQVVELNYTLDASGIKMDCRATGFLDLFKDRFITKTYTNEEATALWRDAIAETQSGDPTDDFGVTDGVQQYTTDVLRDREYVDQNVRDLLVNMTSLVDGNFDFRFNYDRSYEIFQQIGSDRPGNKFTYPYNISSAAVPRTALNLYNYIIGLGSGFGEEALRSIQSDAESRLNYKTRQKIVTFNSVTEQTTLDENTSAYLQRVKDILMLPSIKTDGVFCDLSVIGVGDRVPVEVQGHAAIPLNDTYRIEQIECSLDDNDAEDISLTIDNFGLAGA